jgi:hypothetical protein
MKEAYELSEDQHLLDLHRHWQQAQLGPLYPSLVNEFRGINASFQF